MLSCTTSQSSKGTKFHMVFPAGTVFGTSLNNDGNLVMVVVVPPSTPSSPSATGPGQKRDRQDSRRTEEDDVLTQLVENLLLQGKIDEGVSRSDLATRLGISSEKALEVIRLVMAKRNKK